MAYTKTSKARLATCTKELQQIAYELEKKYPSLQVTCGHRDKAAQDDAYARKVSKAKFGQSPHNTYPSQAVDFVFIEGGKCNWDLNKYKELGKVAVEIGKKLNIPVESGAFWKFVDGPHLQRSGWKALKK